MGLLLFKGLISKHSTIVIYDSRGVQSSKVNSRQSDPVEENTEAIF